MMLLQFTWRPSFSTWMVDRNAPAVFTRSAAGRACNPARFTILTRASISDPTTIVSTGDQVYSVQIQTTDVARGDLVARLRAIAAERTSDRVFLRADGAVPYEVVMQVMGALNAGGFSNIGLVTDAGGPRLDGSDG